MVLVVRSRETWCPAGPVAVLSLFCRKVWIWSLRASRLLRGHCCTGHPQELGVEGMSLGQRMVAAEGR